MKGQARLCQKSKKKKKKAVSIWADKIKINLCMTEGKDS